MLTKLFINGRFYDPIYNDRLWLQTEKRYKPACAGRPLRRFLRRLWRRKK